MYPGYSTVPCSMLLRMLPLSKSYTLDGAVADTCPPPVQSKLVLNVADPTCPGHGEGENTRSPQYQPSAPLLFWPPDTPEGLVGEYYSFGNTVQYTPKPNQVVHPSVTSVFNNSIWEAEPGSARVDNPYNVLPQDSVQGVNRVCNAGCDAGVLAKENKYASCPLTRCLYPSVEGTLYLQEISCAVVPGHFVCHGVENKSRKEVIHCRWKGCATTVARHTFVRHIREVHLGHIRGTSVHISIQGDKPNPSSLGTR